MSHTGIHPDLALVLVRRETDERLTALSRAPRSGLRTRVGRRLLAWGARLAPPERDAPSTTRWVATMAP